LIYYCLHLHPNLLCLILLVTRRMANWTASTSIWDQKYHLASLSQIIYCDFKWAWDSWRERHRVHACFRTTSRSGFGVCWDSCQSNVQDYICFVGSTWQYCSISIKIVFGCFFLFLAWLIKVNKQLFLPSFKLSLGGS
jgi:hypothetical protein